MTDVQLAQCKNCLNRKKGTFDPLDICNIRGFKPKDDESCPYFEQDNKVIPATENKLLYLKPNDLRAKYAIIAVLVVMFLDIISGISSYMQYLLLSDLKSGVSITQEVIDSNDFREQMIGIVYFITFVISAVFFIQWFRRAYFNLHVRTGNTNHSEGWAAGSWFVPIISLFRPHQIMKELDYETGELLENATKKEVKSNATIITTWWALWIISNYFGNYLFKKMLDGDTLENITNLTLLQMANCGLGIPLALLAVYVIKNYADKEAALVAEEHKKPEPQLENLT